VLSAVAKNLEAHLTAIDPHDERSKPEYDAYVDLVRLHGDLASRLRTLAGEMAGHADLPMANHDPAIMASPHLREEFERLVRREEELASLLTTWVAQHRTMLNDSR